MNASPNFGRKNIRLPADRYRGRALFFVTLCFHNRRPFGKNARLATWLVGQLRKHAAACRFYVHAYCIMPDHLHALVAGATDESNLLKLVESFKQETAVELMRRTQRRLWQFKYYDHILPPIASPGISGKIPCVRACARRPPTTRFWGRSRKSAQDS